MWRLNPVDITIVLMVLALIAFGVCSQTAHADLPTAPIPPPTAETYAKGNWRYTYWPVKVGDAEGLVYVIVNQNEIETVIGRLDQEGDGCIGTYEMILVSRYWGQCEEPGE